MEASSCWREHSNAYFLAKFRLDTAENEPCKVVDRHWYRGPAGRPTTGPRAVVDAGEEEAADFKKRPSLFRTLGRSLTRRVTKFISSRAHKGKDGS